MTNPVDRGGSNSLFQMLDDTDGFERTGDDLSRADAVSFLGELGFEQFRVRQDDTQLVVQPVKETDDLRG